MTHATEPSIASRPREPDGPRGNFLFGIMRDFMRDPLGVLTSVAARYGDVARYRIANLIWYQVNHPSGMQHVLQERNRNYGKGELTLRIMRPFGGDGLFLSEGPLWLRQRRLMQPTFHHRHVAALGELMTAATIEMLERWDARSQPGRPLDVSREMMRLALEIVSRALFSRQVGATAEAIGPSITALLDDINFRFKVPFYPPLNVPTPRNRRALAAKRRIDQEIYAIIEARRRGYTGGDDLLALLMAARDEESGAGMSDQQLRDEVVTLYVAGHETTAAALSWTFTLLSQHPAIEAKLRDELAHALGGRTPAVADLPGLPYTRMVIEESLRLYPPVWITNRQAIEEDEICGYRVPAGAIVMLSPYVMHRHPAYWDQPELFDPERFTPERAAQRPAYAYMPFGGGPRQCIGRGFAMVEAQLVLATVLQRYRLRLPAGHTVEPETLATLRPRGGLPMIVEPA